MGPVRARMRALWLALWRGKQLDAAMQEEMRFHIDMEAERLIRERRLHPREARRQAHAAFGGIEKYKEQGRDTRGLRWLDIVSLDTRLGVRMLIKHRGLTLVGGFAMAVAIAIGATFFHVFNEILDPALPLDEGERVVALLYATPTPGSAERRVLRDFVEWRDEIKSVEQLGAFRTAQHNLATGLPPYETITVAEITASGFSVARTPPLMGRYLLPADEREEAPPVVVIGHQAWQARFAGDPHIVGRALNLGGVPFTIVGVMPAGFRFPFDHHYWIPLRTNPVHYERLQGPELDMFGRLAPGVSFQQAQAELTTIGQRTASEYPEKYGRLRPLVLPYTHGHAGMTEPFRVWSVRIAQLFVGALTFVVAVNLAILVYARTVSRLGEIAVRTALGASRLRILVQLFMEALALSAVGAGAGLLLAGVALGQLQSLIQSSNSVAFWIDLELSAGTVLYVIGLAVLAAVIMGVLPGLKATGRRVNASLRDLDIRTGARLGPTWTTLVVAQVAVAVAALPLAVYMSWLVVQMGIAGPEFAVEEFVVGIVAVSDESSATDRDRIRARQVELISRLEAEPGVFAVTFSSGAPGFAPGRQLQFEDGTGAKYKEALGVDTLDVGLDLFDAYGAEILVGRNFTSADLGAANAVIVNRSFVEQWLTTDDALRAQFRYIAPFERPGTRADTSYRIVGVIRDFPSFPPEPGSKGTPAVYHPAAPGDVNPLAISVRLKGGIPAGFIDRFRTIGAEVDPALQLRRIVPLSDFYVQRRSFWRYLAWGVGLLTMSVLLLSAAGIYAMMSFTVAQRTREIAIRTALGAAPHRLLLSIFGRATRQLALGLLVGSVLSAGVFQNTDFTASQATTLTLIVAGILVAVGLIAALGPARRGLRIQASEALRADG